MKEEAEVLLAEQEAHTHLTGRRVRVRRVLTYEGPYAEVQEQLAKSLPDGDQPGRRGTLRRIWTAPVEVIPEGSNE